MILERIYRTVLNLQIIFTLYVILLSCCASISVLYQRDLEGGKLLQILKKVLLVWDSDDVLQHLLASQMPVLQLVCVCVCVCMFICREAIARFNDESRGVDAHSWAAVLKSKFSVLKHRRW